MKLLNTLILLLFLTNTAFAQNATTLNEGDIAPFSGILVKEERLETLVKAEKSNIVLRDLRVTQDELITYHKDTSRLYRKRLATAKWDGFWANTGYLILGIVITSVAFKVNSKIGEM